MGHAAAARRLTHPADTVYNVTHDFHDWKKRLHACLLSSNTAQVKRIMGLVLKDKGVEAELAQFPYKVVEEDIIETQKYSRKTKTVRSLRIDMVCSYVIGLG